MKAVQSVELHRVIYSADIEKPGDFVFIPKREPIRRTTRTTVDPPNGFFKRVLWNLFGTKVRTTETSERVWPDYDAVILMCPHCNQPIGTTREHRIVSTEPLTIEQPLACAYSKPSPSALPTIAFKIQDGKIMPA